MSWISKLWKAIKGEDRFDNPPPSQEDGALRRRIFELEEIEAATRTMRDRLDDPHLYILRDVPSRLYVVMDGDANNLFQVEDLNDLNRAFRMYLEERASEQAQASFDTNVGWGQPVPDPLPEQPAKEKVPRVTHSAIGDRPRALDL